ncbi:Na+-transporting methylmalonyl-CoA/oxaloacetate decarboxylase gamma subunit [Ereboglobus sp. PH5-5]|uniref:OadG family transporter subunit n=1 Tax=unclassified Ereboglobus TaxID=2626932 RepID=UPI00240568B5|nr:MULTISPECIES: OadG family transporter subunit [unclassified Ereboglobus]MDF9828117.1 Na+-transporting methylmalonyl-CoA/oxaloacetate decarboxylase gamma subunit [Ereboglobus sp. PH5-10]MDF9833061.1 Na+-transporting methylmalonyl-CoA/oxaloacetate decarboxylase gamma subunit [Ereboglobus sp. PH5-5]
MILSPLLLGVLPEKPSVAETLVYQFNGLMIVFMVLGGLWILFEITGAIFKRHGALVEKKKAGARASAAAASAPVEASPSAQAEGIAPEVIAVISASIHVALAGRRHRVLTINAAAHGNEWAAEGRRDIFRSHRVR